MSGSPQDVSQTQQVLQAADIVEVVSRYVALRRAGKDFKGLCPFHDDRHPSLTVSQAKQIFKCFSCGVGGDAIKFLQLKENLSFLEARAMLAEIVGIRLERSGGQPAKTDLTRVNAWAADFFRGVLLGPQGQAARQYIQRRGISAESAELFRIGCAPEGWDQLLHAAGSAGVREEPLLEAGLIKRREGGTGCYDAFRNRLMFPIFDIGGHVIGFGGRALDDSPAKYINSPESALFNKSKTLFGLNLAREAAQRAGYVLIVEGYIDCLQCHQHGFGQTVAVLGTALTDMHVQLLRRHVERVVLVFDGDEAGLRAADRALEIALSAQLEVRLAVLPAGCDPADLLVAGRRAEFEAALNQASDALEFRWQRFVEAFGAQEAQGPARRQATEAFLRFLADLPALRASDALQRGMWAARLGGLLGLQAQEVHQALRKLQRPRAPGRPAPDEPAAGAAVRKANAEQVSLQQIVEVLLNEPACYDVAREVLHTAQFADPDLAVVARHLQELCQLGLEWQLTDLLARLPEPRFGQLVTDLQLAGQRRGHFAETLDGAIGYLQHATLLRQRSETVQQLLHRGPDGPASKDAETEGLRRLSQEASPYRHFAPHKELRK